MDDKKGFKLILNIFNLFSSLINIFKILIPKKFQLDFGKVI